MLLADLTTGEWSIIARSFGVISSWLLGCGVISILFSPPEILNKISLENEGLCYQPAFSIEKMDIKIINERLENSGINNLLEFDDTDEYKDIYESFQNLIKTHENKRLMDL